MLFTLRKEFQYDPEVFRASDVQIALAIHDEYVTKHSARPTPRFFEIDRAIENVDPIWHTPKGNRSPISRQLDIPAINYFQKPRWSRTPAGQVPQRKDVFWVSNLGLQRADYFPSIGDMIYWNGFRYGVMHVTIPPEAYWQQCNVFLGLTCECEIVPEGDAKPLQDLSKINISEISPSVQPT
jgi:hypothetical protein